MKTIKSLLAVSVLVAAGAANAAVYDLTGSGASKAFNNTFTLGNTTVTGSGIVDDTGGVFNSATFNYTQNITSPLQAGLSSFVTGTYTIDATGAITDTYTGCTGTVDPCTAIAPLMGVPQNFQATSFNFSNLNSLTWTLISFSEAAGFGTTQTTANYTANFVSPTPSVPVPAAAWLFGSGLLGLAGTARRRKAS